MHRDAPGSRRKNPAAAPPLAYGRVVPCRLWFHLATLAPRRSARPCCRSPQRPCQRHARTPRPSAAQGHMARTRGLQASPSDGAKSATRAMHAQQPPRRCNAPPKTDAAPLPCQGDCDSTCPRVPWSSSCFAGAYFIGSVRADYKHVAQHEQALHARKPARLLRRGPPLGHPP